LVTKKRTVDEGLQAQVRVCDEAIQNELAKIDIETLRLKEMECEELRGQLTSSEGL
jgi:hypothetical protein